MPCRGLADGETARCQQKRKPAPWIAFFASSTDVRAGEGVTALLLATNVFLLMTCYYVLRPIRDGLILSEFSPEVRSYTSAAMVLVLIPVIRLYGILADRVPRQRLINIVTWIFAGCILLFLGLGQLGVPLGIIYFVWLGIFVVMIVAQFWSFANDIYSKEEGERLFPIVALGQSLGPVLGSGIVVVVAGLGIYQLMILGTVLLLVQVQLTNYIDRRERRIKPEVETTAMMTATGSIRIEDIAKMLEEAKTKQAAEDKPAPAPEEGGGMGAYGLVFRTPYLLMIGVLMMLLNFVNTNGEYILSRVVSGRGRTSERPDRGGVHHRLLRPFLPRGQSCGSADAAFRRLARREVPRRRRRPHDPPDHVARCLLADRLLPGADLHPLGEDR